MRIRTLMTTPVETCGPASSLGEAAHAMRTSGCGCLPVVDAHERLVGIITDRDVCRVVGTRRDPWDVPVSEVMARDVVSCRVGDDLDVALVAMKQHGLRRIPVVDASGHVKGLISISDVIRRTGTDARALPPEAVLDVLRHICEAETPLPHV
jgi:CBS domain-containing protein